MVLKITDLKITVPKILGKNIEIKHMVLKITDLKVTVPKILGKLDPKSN